MEDLRFKDYFLFTQHSLATFNKCPLKFKKKYLDGLKWETFPDESVRYNIKKGLDFHLIANRYFMDIDSGLFEDTEEYTDINNLFENLKKNFKLKDKTLYLPEFKLRISNDILKLEANYDLILVDKDSIYIYDWKTRSSNRELNINKMRKGFTESLQTVVYMYVLSMQVSSIKKKYEEKFNEKLDDFSEYNIIMVYWMPEEPFELARINYSKTIHLDYEQKILNNIKNILEYDYEDFDKDLFKSHCKYCEFNWFCNNEKVDFELIEETDEFLGELEWDDLDELY
ncbi:MAG: PD-(D/E)XK nuclease family protein [Clostridiales bacterium]